MPFAHADLPRPHTASASASASAVTRAVEGRPPPPWLKPSAIDDAAERLCGHILRTPMLAAHELGRDLWLKAETFQATGAFKERGALNRLLRLTGGERARGVIAMSAGNHAAGLALHARRLGVRTTIVMPTTAPLCKRERTEALGAELVIAGASVAEARAHALELADERRLTFVHPYDDPDVIAGQGTVGLEILADRPNVGTIVVPVGGGGLLAGVATAVKAAKPWVAVIGARLANRRGRTLADGIAVDALGKLAQAVVADLVDDVVEVSEEEVAFAMRALHRACGIVTEGAGAAAVAALLAGTVVAPGCTVAVLSGRNIDPDTLTRALAAG